MSRYTLLFLCFVLIGLAGCEQNIRRAILSPEEKVELRLHSNDDVISYEINFLGQNVILPSLLGLNTEFGSLSRGRIVDIRTSTVSEKWEPMFGENNLIHNHFTKVEITFKSSDELEMIIHFRLYDDAVAFRYEIPDQQNYQRITITEDHSEFRFEDDYQCRIMGENIEWADFDPQSLSTVEFTKPPVLIHAVHAWVAITEAATFDFSMFYLLNDAQEYKLSADIGPSRISLPAKTPWRVIMIGEEPKDLIVSSVLQNLNEPIAIDDPLWIRPGKALWEWRNRKYVASDGFVYSQDEASLKRLIHFASENHLQYLLIDADWYSHRGPLYPRADLDIEGLINYAQKRDVGILLYIDRRRPDTYNDWDLEEVLEAFSSWGVTGIKYGFLSGEFAGHHTIRIPHEKRMDFVNATWEIVETAAKYQLLVNFHDNPLTPGGENRTWPNLIVTEFGHAQQDGRKSFGPEKAVTVPFINGLTGPLDISNGFFDLNNLHLREKVDRNGIFSTVVGETARLLINYSPLLILPDNGDAYMEKDDLFEFIRQMPDSWDESKVIAGEPGEFILVARRSGERWFVAGNTNHEERTFTIPLDFIGNGDFQFAIFSDNYDTHFKHNKESYRVETRIGNSETPINIYMAPGGGFCMIISKR